jgi:hypothetical protein
MRVAVDIVAVYASTWMSHGVAVSFCWSATSSIQKLFLSGILRRICDRRGTAAEKHTKYEIFDQRTLGILRDANYKIQRSARPSLCLLVAPCCLFHASWLAFLFLVLQSRHVTLKSSPCPRGRRYPPGVFALARSWCFHAYVPLVPRLSAYSSLSKCSNRVRTTCLLVSSISPAKKTSSRIAYTCERGCKHLASRCATILVAFFMCSTTCSYSFQPMSTRNIT